MKLKKVLKKLCGREDVPAITQDLLAVHGIEKAEFCGGEYNELEYSCFPEDIELPDYVNEFIFNAIQSTFEDGQSWNVKIDCGSETHPRMSFVFKERTLEPTEPYYGGREITEEDEPPPSFQALLEKLEAAGVTSVHVEWSGGGDSGGFQSCEAEPSSASFSTELRDAVLSFLQSNEAAAPQCEDNNSGGEWSADINVTEQTLLYPTACNYLDTEEMHDGSFFYEMPMNENRCEICGGVKACQPHSHEVWQKIRDGCIPYKLSQKGTILFLDRSLVEDFSTSPNVEPDEQIHARTLLDVCARIQAGEPAWAIPSLAMPTPYPKNARLALLRLALAMYPYTGPKGLD